MKLTFGVQELSGSRRSTRPRGWRPNWKPSRETSGRQRHLLKNHWSTQDKIQHSLKKHQLNEMDLLGHSFKKHQLNKKYPLLHSFKKIYANKMALPLYSLSKL